MKCMVCINEDRVLVILRWYSEQGDTLLSSIISRDKTKYYSIFDAHGFGTDKDLYLWTSSLKYSQLSPLQNT